MNNRLMAVLAIAAIALVGCDDETMHEAFNLQHDLLTTEWGSATAGDFVEYDDLAAIVPEWCNRPDTYGHLLPDDEERIRAGIDVALSPGADDVRPFEVPSDGRSRETPVQSPEQWWGGL